MYRGSVEDEAESSKKKVLLKEQEALKADIERLKAKKVVFRSEGGMSRIEKEINRDTRRILTKEIDRLMEIIDRINKKLSKA